MGTDDVLSALWQDYVRMTPQASRIHALFAARGEVIANDHIAFRTYAQPGIDLEAMAAPFVALGWAPRERYGFSDKHLRARYFQHPRPELPKIFVSELVVEELPARAREVIAALVAQLPAGFGAQPGFPWAGRPWDLAYGAYRELLEASEYAAWVAAFGFRPNHFTVDVNGLRTFAGLEEVGAFVREQGFALNEVGSVIKGSKRECLEQSSTLADAVEVPFSDRSERIPSCYYEFAKRHPLPSGELFQGFVPTSADKIFHSTDARR
jgi:hypothetical protein